MGNTIGPLLVRAGLISEQQLRTAHQAMRTTDCTFSEQLVVSGAVDETRLCDFYRQRLLVPQLSQEELSRIARNVLSHLSPDMAAEFRVIPYMLEPDGTLILAMADPSDTHAVDEIGFFVSASILRAVAPPSAIAWALHRFYGVSTPLLSRAIETPVATPVVSKVSPAPTPTTTTPPRSVTTTLSGPGAAKPQSTSQVQANESASSSSSDEADHAFASILDALQLANDRDSVADAMVSYLGNLCRRACFFVVRKGHLSGWTGAGVGIDHSSLRGAALTLDYPSIFRDVVGSRLPYRGPVADASSRDFLIEALGWAPQDMLALPVAVRQRVVGVLYGDGRHVVVPDDHLARVTRLASEALERALVRRKSES